MGLATGSTPLETYACLIEACTKGVISFKEVRTFNLDEYVGIPPDHPRSYRYFMDMELFSRIDILPENTHIPIGYHVDPYESSKNYEKEIEKAGGVDLQILGIGSNGHIGFNEPSSSLNSRTRIKSLTRQTIEDNARFFKQGEFQPIQAITMGIKTIMEADTIILIAYGASKAKSVKAAIEGPVSSFCPASILQFHEKAVFVIDEQAASLLENKQYYEHVDELTAHGENFYKFIDI